MASINATEAAERMMDAYNEKQRLYYATLYAQEQQGVSPEAAHRTAVDTVLASYFLFGGPHT
jgi:hypothetical protein